MFISDGASEIIRLFMRAWNERMSATYKNLFKVDFATFDAGHMIHFKGAGFRCQKESNGTETKYYRTYIIGSHNFHPRSGYADKENSLEWREPTDAQCAPPADDFIADRGAYYQSQKGALKAWPNLFIELFYMDDDYSKDYTAFELARMVRYTMYREDGKKYWSRIGTSSSTFLMLFTRADWPMSLASSCSAPHFHLIYNDESKVKVEKMGC